MRRIFLSLAMCCVNLGAWAAGPSIRLDNPQRHVSVTVDRQGADVHSRGLGDVQFRPEALVLDGHALRLRAGHASRSGPQIKQALGQGVSAWYINTPFGIEQGFVLSKPAQGQVAIRIGLGGSLLPYRRGTGLGFSGIRRSPEVLAYSRFIAYDADHRRLAASLQLDGRQVTLSVDARSARFPLTLDPLLSAGPELVSASEYIAPTQIAASSDGATLLVAAPLARTQLGEVYVLTKSGSSWSSAATLANPVSVGKAYFGYSVALSADGQTAVVGAPGNDTISVVPGVYVYTRGSGGWTLAANLSTAGVDPGQIAYSAFGSAVALSTDGNTLLVGASRGNSFNGGAYVYTRSGSTWSGPVALSTPVGSFWDSGARVALSSDGKTAVVASPNAHTDQGAVLVYTFDGSSWSSSPTVLASPTAVTLFGFGEDVAISGDGKTILAANEATLVGPEEVYSYTGSASTWSAPQALDSATEFYEHGLALSFDGNTALVSSAENFFSGAPGYIHVFARSGSAWSAPMALTLTGVPSGATVATAAALSADGRTAYAGVTGTQPVLIYSSPVFAAFDVTPSVTGSVTPDSQVTLAFTVQDEDPDLDATGLVLDEVLPVGASYVSSKGDLGSCGYSSASNSVTCTLASLSNLTGVAWRPSVTIQVPATAGTVTNVASLSADQALDGAPAVDTPITVGATSSGGSSSGASSGGGSSSGGSSGGSSSGGIGGGNGSTHSSGGGTLDLLSLAALLSLVRLRRTRGIMNRPLFWLTALAAMLMGCTAAPAVKDVTHGDQTQYWVIDPRSLPHDTPLEDGCMRVQAAIGSDGKVSDPKVLAVVGLGVAAWIPKGLPQLRYDPAPGNTARTPIRTIIVWTFNYPQSIEAASDATTAQEMQARLAAGPTPEASAWRAKCDAEMDQQMGITPAAAASTVSHR